MGESCKRKLMHLMSYTSDEQAIIQQIVTLSKYGHDALDICHP